MGAEPWDYFVQYEKMCGRAGQLRQYELQAGRYRNYSGTKPATIREAVENADASGTASILDMKRVSQQQTMCCHAIIRRGTSPMLWSD